MSRFFSASPSSPIVTEIEMDFSTSIMWKSVSLNWMFRLAVRQRSIASSSVDFPLSPVPITQLIPPLGSQQRDLSPRKFLISTTRIFAIAHRPCWKL